MTTPNAEPNDGVIPDPDRESLAGDEAGRASETQPDSKIPGQCRTSSAGNDTEGDAASLPDVARGIVGGKFAEALCAASEDAESPTGSAGASPSHCAGSQNDENLYSYAKSVDKKTEMGTPISPKWDEDWIEEVEATEAEVGHRCCGAHAPDGKPCQLESTSKNGRCRFHGGARNIGAPKGNTNARIHGLYMRRVQQCTDKCPMWRTCPLAGKDIMKLPAPNRPLCAYEADEMKALRELDQAGQRASDSGVAAVWQTGASDDRTAHATPREHEHSAGDDHARVESIAGGGTGHELAPANGHVLRELRETERDVAGLPLTDAGAPANNQYLPTHHQPLGE